MNDFRNITQLQLYLFEDIFSKKEKETSTDEIKNDNNDDNGMREFFD